MAYVTKSEQGRRFREFESLEWPVIQPDWVVVEVVLSRAVCSASGASGSLLCRLRQREGCSFKCVSARVPVARDAVIPQVRECDALTLSGRHLASRIIAKRTLRRLSLDVRLRTQLHNTRAAFCSQVRRLLRSKNCFALRNSQALLS